MEHVHEILSTIIAVNCFSLSINIALHMLKTQNASESILWIYLYCLFFSQPLIFNVIL